MRAILVGLAAVLILTSAALAGSNAGGTLLLHALDVTFTTDNTGYCGEYVPRDCESINSRSSGAPTQVYVVLAVFTDANKPRLRGVEFGISYSALEIEAYGSCANFDYPMLGWPQSGRGTVVTWTVHQTEHIVPVYWFAGYLASLATPPTFTLTPHPNNGGHFGDDYIPTHLDEIADYGALGFGTDGSAPCPAARTFVIRPDGSGDRPTIQSAIYVAAPGSVIALEDGVYRGPGNRDIQMNDTYLTVRSISGNPSACIIDCQGVPGESHRAFAVRHHEPSSPVIEGIKIVGGYMDEDAGFDAVGAAVTVGENSSLTMRNCVFEGCSAKNFGGAVNASGGTVFEDCIFVNNAARERSGGAIWGTTTLRRCRFEGNRASLENGGAIGGGSAQVHAEDCVFLDNHSRVGGAVWLNQSEASFSGCTWSGNEAPKGGALYCTGGQVLIERSTLSDNASASGSAVYCDAIAGSLDLRNTILSFGASGGAIRCGSLTISTQSCDIFGNAGGDWPSCLLDQSHINGNFSADPLYCDRAQGDYHLASSSPCAEEADPIRGQVGAWPVGCGDLSGLEDAVTPASSSRPLLQSVTPNPFRDRTVVQYVVPAGLAQPVQMQIFDAAGRLVRVLAEGEQAAGAHEVRWDGRNAAGAPAPGGIYLIRVCVGARHATARLLRIR